MKSKILAVLLFLSILTNIYLIQVQPFSKDILEMKDKINQLEITNSEMSKQIYRDNLSMMNISLEIKPGKGRILVDTKHLMGVVFQDAANTAVYAAQKKTGKDMTMTGTIDKDGHVGEIGGVIEKAKAAKDSGKNLILLSRENSRLIQYIEKARNFYGVTVIERVPEIIDCVVLKPLALYTHLLNMGKRNKVVKLTKKKIDYIIRAKTRNDSNKNKSRRRKAWIRYERKHSLSAVHLDWHTGKVIKKEVCVVEDDSSRYILSGGEFDAATADFSINLVQEVLDNYGWFGKIKQAITDRGTQFYTNKKDKNEESQSRFEAFLLEKEIKHIKARVKHPQTNGKVEKWFDLYEKYRLEFDTFADFVKWYNTTRYHESLDQKHFLQTPENAFWARLPEGSKLNIFLKRMEVELNVYGRIYK
jgi:putative transposase